MAKINVTETGTVTIEIADPVELERLITVLHRTQSTKVIAIREAIIAGLMPEPTVDAGVVETMIAELEKIANGE